MRIKEKDLPSLLIESTVPVFPVAIEEPGAGTAYSLKLNVELVDLPNTSEVFIETSRGEQRTWKTLDSLKSFINKNIPTANSFTVECKG